MGMDNAHSPQELYAVDAKARVGIQVEGRIDCYDLRGKLSYTAQEYTRPKVVNLLVLDGV